ncbi:MAG TPA: FAD-binding protein [Fimbriimonadales bacterium]|nr:FAD-binding protein [Fimbriimonadales bacterium]
MAKLLLIAENPSEAAPLAAFAQRYGQPFDLLLLMGEPKEGYQEETCFCAELEDVPPSEVLVRGLTELARKYPVIAGLSTMFGKDFLPRLSGALVRPMVSDVMEIHESREFTRPMFAGNILARVHVDSDEFVVSVRSTAFRNPERTESVRKERISLNCEGVTKRISKSAPKSGRPDLTQARVVVSGGRPLKDAATFELLIGGLADALGGAAGATRAAVDSGIAPNELQVGQTGKIVAPELYIAVGISGSTQHLAGMKDSKVIVAINIDPDAPIFQVADYGLVEDLYVAVPKMIEKLKDFKGKT